ncbi:hypothetical protein BJX68DRAFT_244031 [Aspergillus pseudodeflectus]|uniref:C2H2-type domain-containing protein n=1 Tax=Aspergillus pseudodeflectus TaxID=176178 RepID=A0ABR4JTV4_9EURO
MDSNQVSSGYYPSLVVPNRSEEWTSQLVPGARVDLSVDPSMLPNSSGPTGLAPSTTSAQSYTVSPAFNFECQVPSVYDSSNWLPDTRAPYTSSSQPGEPGARQSMQFAQSSTAYAPQAWSGFDYSIHQDTYPSTGSKDTFPDTSSQLASAVDPRIVPPRAFKCKWRGCTYTGTFSRPAQLKRHVDTQHINPGSFACQVPGCAKTFNRKDNLGVHSRKMHPGDTLHWQGLTMEREMEFIG